MAKREFPDPSLPVTNDDLWGFTYGERTLIRRRRKEWLAANKEAVEAEKAKHARTCQICGRAIFAETGVIAHHGYTRPFEGYQTPSCYGARHLPFEKSRDTLGKWIVQVTQWRDKARNAAVLVRGSQTSLPFRWVENVSVHGRRVDKAKVFWAATPEEYSWVQAVYFARRYPYHSYVDASKLKTWEEARELHAKEYDRDAEGWEAERKMQQARYDAWVQVEEV